MSTRKRTFDSANVAAQPPTPDGSRPASRRRVTKTSAAYAKAEEFRQFFKDPPNAEALVDRTKTGSVAVADNQEDQEPEDGQAAESSKSRSQYRGLQFNGSNTNVRRIFIAVHFLHVHLRNRAHLDDDNFRFSMAKDGGDFKAIATDLEEEEPLLKGVTGCALRSMFDRIVQKRRELEEFITRATGDPWAPTKLSDMAWDLVLVDDEIRARQERKTAEKEGLIAEADARDTRALITAVTTVGPRKRMRPAERPSSSSTSNDQPAPAPAATTAAEATSTTTAAATATTLTAATATSTTTAAATATTTTAATATTTTAATATTTTAATATTTTAAEPSQPTETSRASKTTPIPKLTRQPSSLSSRGGSLFSNEEQEAYKDESRSRAMAIARTVQDLSAETSLKLSSFDARLQALETSYQTNLQSMDERMKNMEDMVKVMKESLDKALTSIPFKFQGINDRLQFVQSRIDAFEKFMDPSGIK